MKRKILLFAMGAFVWASCQSTPEEGIQEIKGSANDFSSLIRMPVSAEGRDTVNVARFEFAETEFNFGTVEEGDTVRHEFAFTNSGKVPLVITSAKSTCGCTIPEYPEEAIAPGDSGVIAVVFNTKGKRMGQTKPITLTANTYPGQTRLYLRGFVNPAPVEPSKN